MLYCLSECCGKLAGVQMQQGRDRDRLTVVRQREMALRAYGWDDHKLEQNECRERIARRNHAMTLTGLRRFGRSMKQKDLPLFS